METIIRNFATQYIKSDCDWEGTCEKMGFNPYDHSEWDWDLWNDLMDDEEFVDSI